MVLTRSQSRAARSAAQAARYAARRRARYASRRLTPAQREAQNSANAASMRQARAALSDDARAAVNSANAAAMRRTRAALSDDARGAQNSANAAAMRQARAALSDDARAARNSTNAAAMRRARAALSDDARAAVNAANAAAMRRARERCAGPEARALNRENVARCRLRLACLHDRFDAARMREHVAGVLRGYRGRPEQRRERELCIELAPIAGEDDADYMERVRLIRRRHLRWRSHREVTPCTLPAREACRHCGSLMWPDEKTACCRQGRYILPAEHFHVPEELRVMYQNRHVQFYARCRTALACRYDAHTHCSLRSRFINACVAFTAAYANPGSDLGGRGFHNPTPYPCAQALMGTSYHHAVPASAVDLHLRTWPSLSTLYVQRCTI